MVSNSKEEFNVRIKELRDALSKASLHHDIWRFYKIEREDYLEILNNDSYLLFFTTSISAHFTACVTNLSLLYETRRDTHNIPGILQFSKSNLSKETIVELESLYEKIKPIWIKIYLLRNEVFGHRSNEKTIEEVFKEANLKVDNFKEIIDMSKKFLNILSYAINNEVDAFNLKSSDSIKNVLEDLKSKNSNN